MARGQICLDRARAILAARGIDLAAGADALAAAIGARGWRVETERNDAGGRRAGGPVRWRALATPGGGAGMTTRERQHVRTGVGGAPSAGPAPPRLCRPAGRKVGSVCRSELPPCRFERGWADDLDDVGVAPRGCPEAIPVGWPPRVGFAGHRFAHVPIEGLATPGRLQREDARGL